MSLAVQFDRYGGVDVLEVREVPPPVAGPGEVVVAVKSAGVNPSDGAVRDGFFDAMSPTTFPSGQGSDLAGVVSAVGPGVTRFEVGDDVLGWSLQHSAQAEYCSLPVDQLIAKPPALTWRVAGALYGVGVTAYAAVRAVAAGPGDTVVVSAAAGGVGSVTVQLLRVRGAAVVGIASPVNHDWLRSKGAIPVAYGEGLAERVKAAAPRVDAFIDLFGPQYVQLAVELGIPADRIETTISFEAAGRYGTRADGAANATTPEILTELAQLAASGQIEIPIAAYPMQRVRDAYIEVEKRHTRGKIVLIP